MYAPKGFVPLSVLVSRIANSDVFDLVGDYFGTDMFDFFKFAVLRTEDLAFAWMLDLIGNDIYASSPNGRELKLDRALFDAKFYVDLFSEAFIRDILFQIPSYIKSRFEFCVPITQIQIDAYVEVVSKAQDCLPDERAKYDSEIKDLTEEMGAKNGRTAPPLFVSLSTGQIDFELFDTLNENLARDDMALVLSDSIPHVARVFRKLDGWSLCVPEHVIESPKWDEFWAEKLVKVRQNQMETLERDEESPALRKRDRAGLAYSQLYPNGHQLAGVYWAEVEFEVSQQINAKVSKDTILRALGRKK